MTLNTPEIGSRQRTHDEESAIERGRCLLHEHEGSIRDALHYLREELRASLRGDDATIEGARYARNYSRALVRYVEECWATAILR